MESYHPFQSQAAKAAYTKYYRQQEEENWPVPYEDIMVDTIYGSTFVRVSGPKDGPPLVLLSGITATSLMWVPNVETWSQHYRVYAVDTINDYGLSVNTRGLYRKKDLLLWLNNLFAKLAPGEKINLVGMSYGGWLAGIYALTHQENLAKVVMIAPGATVLPISWKFFACLFAIFFLPGIIVQPFLLHLATSSVDAEDIQANDLSNFITCFLRGYSKFKHRFVVPLSVLTPEDWKKITIPTLFIAGSDEKLYDAEEAITHLGQVAPQVHTLLVPNCGHDLTFVQSEIINSSVLTFLNNKTIDAGITK